MSNLTAVEWSNLVANRNSGISHVEMHDAIVRMMVLHLHRDHEYGVRKIARSLGIKEKQVKFMVDGVEK